MYLELLVHLFEELKVVRRKITKLIDDGLRGFRWLQAVRFLDNLFLSSYCSNAGNQRDQVYLDGTET
jgi:hypothetical protein